MVGRRRKEGKGRGVGGGGGEGGGAVVGRKERDDRHPGRLALALLTSQTAWCQGHRQGSLGIA